MSFKHIGISFASDLAKEVSAAKDISIKKQLDWFISRGLLEIHTGPETMVSKTNPETGAYEVEFRTSCELVLKDKEYIEKIEKELALKTNILNEFYKIMRSEEGR